MAFVADLKWSQHDVWNLLVSSVAKQGYKPIAFKKLFEQKGRTKFA